MRNDFLVFMNKQFCERYREWLALPMTVHVIRALEEGNRASLPSMNDVHANATQAALNAGRADCIHTMQNLDQIHQEQPELIPTYLDEEEIPRKRRPKKKQ